MREVLHLRLNSSTNLGAIRERVHTSPVRTGLLEHGTESIVGDHDLEATAKAGQAGRLPECLSAPPDGPAPTTRCRARARVTRSPFGTCPTPPAS